jgi:vacuolar protein sorting-associated protein 35
MDVLEHNTRKQMAVTIVRCVLKSGTIVQEVEQVDMLFEFISLLIKDDEAFTDAVRVPHVCPDLTGAHRSPLTPLLPGQNIDEEDFEEEQNLVARLVHHLSCPNSEGQYRVLLAARRHFGQGGPKRLRHTLPPLIFSGLQLVRQLHAQTADGEGTRRGNAC